jgi:hypothetical protein
MSPNCLDVDRIAEVGAVPEGHPLREHVANCPRCQSLWLSYQSFMKADLGGAARAGEARATLEESIRRRAAASGRAWPPVSLSARRPRWSGWLRPALVTAVAAALTLTAITLWRGDGEQPVLRGVEDARWLLAAPRPLDGRIEFEWQAVEDADAYELVLYDDALNEVYRSGTVTATTATVLREALPGVADGASLTWRVLALRAGDVISTSPPSSLTLP